MIDFSPLKSCSSTLYTPRPVDCLAGVKQAVERGVIQPGQRVVAVLTGHLLKDPDTTLRYHAGELGGSRTNPPVTIAPTLEALAAVVEGDR